MSSSISQAESARRWARADEIERRFEIPLLIAAAFVLPSMVLQADDQLASGWQTLGSVLNWIIWLAFAAEFLMLIRTTRDPRAVIRSHPLLAVIVFLTVPILTAIFPALRVLQLLRLFSAARIAHRLFRLESLAYAALLALALLVAGGLAYAEVEQDAGSSANDGLWWALVTVTTVGYGDISPTTDAGRLIGAGVMVLGIGFIALLTGAVTHRFIAVNNQEAESASAEEQAKILAELREVSGRLERLEPAVLDQNRRGDD
jgi:voltage-gated potassium channel